MIGSLIEAEQARENDGMKTFRLTCAQCGKVSELRLFPSCVPDGRRSKSFCNTKCRTKFYKGKKDGSISALVL